MIPLSTIVAGLLVTGSPTDFGLRDTCDQSKCQLSKADSAYVADKPLYRDCAVDQKAQLIGLAPNPDLREMPQRPGTYRVVIQFVVDTLGTPESGTVHVTRTTSNEFAEAVLATIPRLHYRPAHKDGVAVRQIVTIDREVRAAIERQRIR